LVVIPIRRRTERDLSDAICAFLAADPRIAIARSLAALRRLGMTSFVSVLPSTHSMHFVIFVVFPASSDRQNA